MEVEKAVKVVEKLAQNGHDVGALAEAGGLQHTYANKIVAKAKSALTNILAEDDDIALKVVDVYRKAMDAMRPVVTKDGIEYVPDWHARHKFSQDVLIMRGWLKSGSSSISNNQLVINLHGLAEKAERIVVEHPEGVIDAEHS